MCVNGCRVYIIFIFTEQMRVYVCELSVNACGNDDAHHNLVEFYGIWWECVRSFSNRARVDVKKIQHVERRCTRRVGGDMGEQPSAYQRIPLMVVWERFFDVIRLRMVEFHSILWL